MKPRTARYLLGAVFGNLIIVGAGFINFVSLGLGPDGCAIEDSCGDYFSTKSYHTSLALTIIITIAVLIVFNLLLAKRQAASSNNKLKEMRRFLGGVFLLLYVTPAVVLLSWLHLDNYLQRHRLTHELSIIPITQGCTQSSEHYSKPGITAKYRCSQRLTNAMLYANINTKMHDAGYQTYYDRTFGSSLKYNAYEFGLSKGHYEAVYLFDNQTNFVDAHQSGIAEQPAGGYTLKLYEN